MEQILKPLLKVISKCDGHILNSVKERFYSNDIASQPSIPSEEKQQDKVVDKWNELLEKEADKTDKKNEHVKSIVVGEHTGRIFK